MNALKQEFERVCPDAGTREDLLRRFDQIHRDVDCPHNPSHVLSFVIEMFRFQYEHPGSHGVFVEAGCYKGGSSAKFSLATKMLGRELYLCDSFEGLPNNQEEHERSIFGYSIKDWFRAGKFAGSLEEVKRSLSEYGAPDVCTFVPGWFEESLPSFNERIAGAYLDVDLASSTRTCLKYLYPLVEPGGFLISQDGDFPLVIEVFEDEKLWRDEIGVAPPQVMGLHKAKMLKIIKPKE
ncbi:MAG: hypothetical protein EA397_20075 [Deltaproteobacteria bacterium]|nr:MAG: hypothetical protein EA397_20075 [Deltaproteobacteria bacterium]